MSRFCKHCPVTIFDSGHQVTSFAEAAKNTHDNITHLAICVCVCACVLFGANRRTPRTDWCVQFTLDCNSRARNQCLDDALPTTPYIQWYISALTKMRLNQTTPRPEARFAYFFSFLATERNSGNLNGSQLCFLAPRLTSRQKRGQVTKQGSF